jgi:hypothetical protein
VSEVPELPEPPEALEVPESPEALEACRPRLTRVLNAEIKFAAKELKNLLLSKGDVVDGFVSAYKAFRVEMKKIDPEFYQRNQDEWVETIKDLLREAFNKINSASGKADLNKTRREAVKALKAEMNLMLNLLKERKAVMKQSKIMTAPVSDAPAAVSAKEATVSPDLPEPSASEAPVTEASDTDTVGPEASGAEVAGTAEADTVGLKSEGRVNSWTKKLGFVKEEGIISLKSGHDGLNARGVNEFISLVREVLSLLNAFKNKGFHEGKENIPVVNDLIAEFLQFVVEGKVVKPEKGDLFLNEWMYNLLILNLYVKSVCIAKSRGEGTHEEDEGVDLDTLSDTLKDILHPSIKSMITSRGVKLTQNLYVAFDTEYQGIDVRKNELLSVQLAGNVGLYLKIPRLYPYRMQYINPSNATKSFIFVEGEYQNSVKQLIESSIDRAVKNLYKLTHVKY